MPTDKELIPTPILDERTEAQFIADTLYAMLPDPPQADDEAAIARWEAECERNVAIWQAARPLRRERGKNLDPKTSELTSMRAPESHVVIITNVMRPHVETRFRFNHLPAKIRIELLRQLGVVLQAARPATTTLRFTKSPGFINDEVAVPAGTEVRSIDGQVTVITDSELVIEAGVTSGTVGATSVEAGDFESIDAFTLGQLGDPLVGIESVTNVIPLSGGAKAETVQEGVIRAREEMRVGEHLGSAQDFADHIFFKVLNRRGRVTAFEGYFSDFSPAVVLSNSSEGLVELPSPGYLLLVVQSQGGFSPSEQLFEAINAVVRQRKVAGIYVSVRAPAYRNFDITAQVTFARGQQSETIKSKAKALLRDFYSPLKFPYGPEFTNRKIGVGDIAARIDDAAPDLIDVSTVGGKLQVVISSDGVDYDDHLSLSVGELPKLQNINLVTVS
jgi:hypothetical protein